MKIRAVCPSNVLRPYEKTVPQIVTRSLPDAVVLYHTLVADGALPPGYELELSSLGLVIQSAAQRHDSRVRVLFTPSVLRTEEATGKGNQDVGRPVSPRHRNSATDVQVSSSTEPLHRSDSTKGRGGEGAIPLGGRISGHGHRHQWEKYLLGSVQLLGAGRCASTLRSRLCAVRRFLNWLAFNHDIG